jgi:hypothetical protein
LKTNMLSSGMRRYEDFPDSNLNSSFSYQCMRLYGMHGRRINKYRVIKMLQCLLRYICIDEFSLEFAANTGTLYKFVESVSYTLLLKRKLVQDSLIANDVCTIINDYAFPVEVIRKYLCDIWCTDFDGYLMSSIYSTDRKYDDLLYHYINIIE